MGPEKGFYTGQRVRHPGKRLRLVERPAGSKLTRAGGRGMAPAREDEVIVGALPLLSVAPFVRTCQDRYLALFPGPHPVNVVSGLVTNPLGSAGDYLSGLFAGFGCE